MTEIVHPGMLSDGVIELRRWQDLDAVAVGAGQSYSDEEALAWVRRQQARPLSIGISFAIAPIESPAAGYVGLIRRPRLELGRPSPG